MRCDGCGATTPTTAGWVHIGPVSDPLAGALLLGDFCPVCVEVMRRAIRAAAILRLAVPEPEPGVWCPVHGMDGCRHPGRCVGMACAELNPPLDTYRLPVL